MISIFEVLPHRDLIWDAESIGEVLTINVTGSGNQKSPRPYYQINKLARCRRLCPQSYIDIVHQIHNSIIII